MTVTQPIPDMAGSYRWPDRSPVVESGEVRGARSRPSREPDEHRRRRALPVHLRVGHRRPPGQDVRPDLGRHPRRDPPRGPERARRLRDRDDHRPRARPRRDLDHDLRRLPERRPRHRPRHRLHEGRVRLRLPDLRHARVGQGAVGRHRDGRRRGARGPVRRRARERARRRRPGDDVRLRLPRDAGADAAADRARAPHGAPARRGPQERPAAVPPPRRQDPGHRRVRARRPEAGAHGRRVLAARPRRPQRADPQRPRPGGHPAGDPGGAAPRGPGDARQPDRALRHRRPDGRRRPHRPQDHRRLVRRHGPPRRRRVQRQGPDEGRPVRGLRRPLGRQERRGRGPRGPVRDRGRVRHRHRPPDLAVDRDVRDRARSRTTKIQQLVERHFDLRPASIIDALDLRRPIYRQTAAYGHFGRVDLDLPWERTDKAAALAADAGLPEPVLAEATSAA